MNRLRAAEVTRFRAFSDLRGYLWLQLTDAFDTTEEAALPSCGGPWDSAMPLRCCYALLILALLLNGSAQAAGGMGRDRFVATHKCEVLSRLNRIHEAGPRNTSKDRFLVVSIRDLPQRYVQCIFFDGDRRMLCEASSGAYRFRPDDGQKLVMTPESVTALQNLGFVQEKVDENFKREVDLGSPPNMTRVVILMLSALQEAYQAQPTDLLEYIAPKAQSLDPRCSPSARN